MQCRNITIFEKIYQNNLLLRSLFIARNIAWFDVISSFLYISILDKINLRSEWFKMFQSPPAFNMRCNMKFSDRVVEPKISFSNVSLARHILLIYHLNSYIFRSIDELTLTDFDCSLAKTVMIESYNNDELLEI